MADRVRWHRRQTGFTLLELLIAMALMGLILVILYGGLRVGIRSWESGEVWAERVDEIRLVQGLIRRQFGQSMPVFFNEENEGRVLAFTGEPQRVNLVTPMLAHLGRGGLYFVQIDTIEENETEHLRMRWWPYRPKAPEDTEDSEETLLLSDVSEVEWSFFGALEPDLDPEWQDSWESASQRPMLARLRLRLLGEPWPELVMNLSH